MMFLNPRFKKLFFLSIILLLILIKVFYWEWRGEESSSRPSSSILDSFNKLPKDLGVSPDLSHKDKVTNNESIEVKKKKNEEEEENESANRISHYETCQPLEFLPSEISTVRTFQKFNFNADWIDKREYWGPKFEKRYKQRRKLWSKLPLKVIIVPHSHNDPGWLKTVENYFSTSTKNILNFAVDKLTKYKNMTFIWTEMSYLNMWYETAHPARKENLKRLIAEKRFEVPTGGWVMTDEANVHLFAMVDQLIEGHHWLKNTLNFEPTTSWSVDPFGHGGTFPYVLKKSGIEGMLIMRIHYAWKEWFARHQNGDFKWTQSWDKTGKDSILCHNFPYDIYSIKGSCGPTARVCLEYNFRKISNEYNEYTARNIAIHAANVQERAELILEQYGKTGSLLPHNVVLVPLGDDFTYNHEIEWDQQYTNYKMIMDYINSKPEEYHAEIKFGTVTDYFKAVNERMSTFPTLNGDFFVYSDIFSEGRPAYWSGYFTTRPFMKQLSRELENTLRSSEILFSVVYNIARQTSNDDAIDFFMRLYPDLVTSRRHLGLFQHHDAITGTSKQYVMHDYGVKMYDGVVKTRNLIRHALQYLMHIKPDVYVNKLIRDDYERTEYTDTPMPTPLNLKYHNETIIVFNSLAQEKYEVVTFFIDLKVIKHGDKRLCILDPVTNEYLNYQVNPTWNTTGFFRLDINFVEVAFMVKLPPLSIRKFIIDSCSIEIVEKTELYCSRCPSNNNNSYTVMSPMKGGNIKIENSRFSLLIDEELKMLKSVTNKKTRRSENVEIVFAAYPTAQFRSGAYLFKPDDHQPENVQVFNIEKNLKEIVIISGPIFSEISVIFESPVMTQNQLKTAMSDQIPGSFAHTIRLYHGPKESELTRGIYIENNFDLGGEMNNKDIDIFMRFVTNIDNGRTPIFYSDSNGFQMQKRVKVEDIGIQGNYFPITTMAYIEDDELRLSLAVDHAQGAASWQKGWLEVMVDRRSSYDDSRGMGEGVLDSRATSHKYWLLMEEKFNSQSSIDYPIVSVPSDLANILSRRLNYPTLQFISSTKSGTKFFQNQVNLMAGSLPCDTHLFNLRTLSKADVPSQTYPSDVALMILQKQSSQCDLNSISNEHNICYKSSIHSNFFPKDLLKISNVMNTSLTGLKNGTSSPDLEKTLKKLEAMSLTTVKVKF